MALGLCALSAQAVDEPQFTYYYQMEKVDTSSSTAEDGYDVFHAYFKLYVARQGDGAPPLHTGSIALGTTEKEATLEFETAEHWTMLPQERQSDPAGVTPESGAATEEKEPYLSFNWGVKEGHDIPTEADGRQFIGTLAVADAPGLTADEVVLLPWPETVTGAARVKDWQDETDPARKGAYLRALQSIWRMDDPSRPAEGFYQGYYQWNGSAGTEDGAENQRVTDIQNGWQAFRVQSYNPFKDVTLTVTDAEGTTKSVVYDNKAQGSAIPGRVTFAPELGGFAALEAGTYSLTVSKPSHAAVTYTGLTVGDGKVFPELVGKLCYLPCGDVTGGVENKPDGRIKQADRAYLTRPGIYGKTADKKGLLDLDGDGHVGQRDLAILTAPANYGKSAKTISIKSGTEGGTT